MLIAEENHQHYPQNYADKAGPRSSLGARATGIMFIHHQMEVPPVNGSGPAATGPTLPVVRVWATEHLPEYPVVIMFRVYFFPTQFI